MIIELFDRQRFVLDTLVNGDANELLYGGAAAGGKSFLLRAIAIIFAINVPGVQIFLFRRTVKDLKATHLFGASSFPVLLDEFLTDKLVNINLSNGLIQFKNKSQINLCHCQHESDLNNYLSAEFNILLIDEVTTFTEKMVRFLRSRVRLGSLTIPEEFKKAMPFILYCTNPRGVSHVYFKRNFVDYADAMTAFKAKKSEGGMMRMFIPSKIDDNPFIEDSYADRLLGLGDEDVVAAYLEGDWSVVEGAALKRLSIKTHVIKEELVCPSWRKYRAYDYGQSAPYVVLWFAIATGESSTKFNPPKDTIIIVGHIYGADEDDHGINEEVEVTAKKIKVYEQDHFPNQRVYAGPADNSIFDKDRGPSIAKRMESESITWEPSNKSPGSRVNGLSLCKSRLRNDKERSGLYFVESTKPIVRQLIALPLSEKNPEDVDTESNDHSWDTLRYIILFKENIISTCTVGGK